MFDETRDWEYTWWDGEIGDGIMEVDLEKKALDKSEKLEGTEPEKKSCKFLNCFMRVDWKEI